MVNESVAEVGVLGCVAPYFLSSLAVLTAGSLAIDAALASGPLLATAVAISGFVALYGFFATLACVVFSKNADQFYVNIRKAFFLKGVSQAPQRSKVTEVLESQCWIGLREKAEGIIMNNLSSAQLSPYLQKGVFFVDISKNFLRKRVLSTLKCALK